MKYLAFLSLLSFSCISIYAQPAKVTGYIKGYTQPKIYMTIFGGDKLLRDSAIVNNGSFSFSIDIKEPLVARLITRDKSKKITDQASGYTSFAPIIQIYLEPKANLILTGDYNNWPIVHIKGGKSNELQSAYYQQNNLTILAEESAFKESIALKNAGDTINFKNKDVLRLKNMAINNSSYQQLLEKNPQTLFGVFQVYESLAFVTDEAKLKKVLNNLPLSLLNGVYGLAIQKRYNELKDSGVGTLAKKFNVNGKDSLINLEAYRGKYVLLDFWGSWCVPCREGNPHLKELYATYKDKGFEIIGIANEKGEKQREVWLKAISQDGLPWINILNSEAIKRNGQDLISLFAIKSYPTKILIDPQGKIILKTQSESGELDELLKRALHKE